MRLLLIDLFPTHFPRVLDFCLSFPWLLWLDPSNLCLRRKQLSGVGGRALLQRPRVFKKTVIVHTSGAPHVCSQATSTGEGGGGEVVFTGVCVCVLDSTFIYNTAC